jgi:hypothetical protein
VPIEISVSGQFSVTERFLASIGRGQMFRNLDAYAQRGVEALSAATPAETGVTAASWSYEISANPAGAVIAWTNTHLDAAGTPIAIMLQYGHGTGTGGYVQGRDYINPAIQPIFDEIANAVWREVMSNG